MNKYLLRASILPALLVLLTCPQARADEVTDWTLRTDAIIAKTDMRGAAANRVMAVANTSVYEAVNSITRRYPDDGFKLRARRGASIGAAVAAANHVALLKLLPTQDAAIEAAYQDALSKIAEGPAKSDGIAAGEAAAQAVLASRSGDASVPVESYRPVTKPGVYMPTAIPLASTWAQRKPWLLHDAAQFRPGPPPALDSALWARDYNEIKTMGAKNGAQRSAE